MSESFDWHSFLESVEDLCRQVEHRIQLSDSNTLQDFLFRLQAKRTACERLIGAAVASGVDTSVSENVQGNVKRLSNVIQHLIDDVERQLQSVDSRSPSVISRKEIISPLSGLNSKTIPYNRKDKCTSTTSTKLNS